jgi:hypothetical protein
VSKARTESELSAQLDSNLTTRLRELSDLKRAIRDAEPTSRTVLLKALVAISYAHWEGYVKYSATKYFEFVSIRRLPYSALSRQFYANAFLARIASFSTSKPSVKARIDFVDEVLSASTQRFSHINPDLVNTGSNLKFETLKDICLVCEIDIGAFEAHETFIDVFLLKRRNSIAHGDDAIVGVDEIDSLVDSTIKLMRTFKNELENKIYTKAYIRQ